jgi:hypothetical protein
MLSDPWEPGQNPFNNLAWNFGGRRILLIYALLHSYPFVNGEQKPVFASGSIKRRWKRRLKTRLVLHVGFHPTKFPLEFIFRIVCTHVWLMNMPRRLIIDRLQRSDGDSSSVLKQVPLDWSVIDLSYVTAKTKKMDCLRIWYHALFASAWFSLIGFQIALCGRAA